MTWEEIRPYFNAGCRIRLPSIGKAWPKNWYWKKIDNNKIEWGDITKRLNIHPNIDALFDYTKGKKDKNSDKWYIHPDDQKVYKFNKKLKELIEE